MDRIGEPYVTTAPPASACDAESERNGGLGLGFFIAKTLLERSGATLTFEQPSVRRARGRSSRVRWARAANFEISALTFGAT